MLLTGGNLLQAGIAFAVNLILVRYITPSEFGSFAIAFAEASLFYAVLSIRTNALIIRASEHAFSETAKDVYFNAALQETVFATAVIFIWFWVTGGVGIWESVIVLTLAVRHWTVLNKGFYERKLPYKALSAVETGSALSAHLAALVAVLAGAGWVALVLREIVLSVATLLGLAKVGGLTFRRVRLLSVGEYSDLFRESRGVWLDGVLEGTFQRLTVMAAGFMGGEALAGLVFQAQRLALVPHQILAPIVNRIMLNWFARTEDPVRRRRGRTRMVLATLGPLSVVAVFIVLFADPVVPWLLGDGWASVSTLMVGMAGFVVFISPFEILRSYCFAIRHTRMILAARVFQHLGFFIPPALAMAGVISTADGLSFGFSVAYAGAFICVAGLLYRMEKNG